MKESLTKAVFSFLLAVGLTTYFYWPVYTNIKLDNSISDISTEIKRLNLPLGDEIKEILNRFAQIPINRHQLCLENNNRVYLIHADSERVGITFHTDDISRTPFGTTSKIGSMAIEMYYTDGSPKFENYREIGQPKLCKELDVQKLELYASSTALYRHARLKRTDELELEGLGKLVIGRIIGNSFIDTSNSKASIVPRWPLFWFTLITLSAIFWKLTGWVSHLLMRFQKHTSNNIEPKRDQTS